MNLLIYLGHIMAPPAGDLAFLIRDMIMHYDKKHNGQVQRLIEMERIIFTTKTYPADLFRELIRC